MISLTALMGLFLFTGAQAFAMPAPSYAVTLTAYNAVPAQTDGDPFVTASGIYSNPEIVAARSRDLADELPFGTIIEIDGADASGNACGYPVVKPIVGYRVIADTMNARFTDYIDILFSTRSNYTLASGSKKNASTILGVCSDVTVHAVGFVDLTHSNHIPKTQAELVALVKGTSDLALK